MMNLVSVVLKHGGFRTREAPTLETAFALVAKEPPDAILLDYTIERETPELFVDYVRANNNIPIFLMTGNTHADALAQILKTTALFKKPILDLAEFLQQLRNFLKV